MSVQVYGCNHVAIEVDDVEKAVAFYKDVFNLEQMSGGEGDAFFKLGDHQFLAIFEVEKVTEEDRYIVLQYLSANFGTDETKTEQHKSGG